MFDLYHHLPEHINPVAISVGNFSLYWYALLYLLAFGIGFLVFRRVVQYYVPGFSIEQSEEWLLYMLVGALLGARLGYVLFYNASFYAQHPLAIILPFDTVTGTWTGISGMSYYGGLVGVILAFWFFSRKKHISFWSLADATALAVPVGYFFGRLGNFVNGELFGRATTGWWGMFFPFDGTNGTVLRHPSQLYEAFFEGIVLFIILKKVSQGGKDFPGRTAAIYIMGYSLIRFVIEYAREPDPQLGILAGGMTLGQYLSLLTFMSGIAVFLWLKNRKYATL